MLDKSRNMLISNAFRKANITSIESEPTEAEIADAAHTLNAMLQSWNNDGFRLFKIKDGYMPFIPKKNDYSLATQAYKSIESTKITRIDRIGGTKIELTNYANIAPGQKLIVVNDVRTADNYIADVDYDSGIVTLQNPLEHSVYANDIVFYGDFYIGTTPVKRFVGSFNTLEYNEYTIPPSAGDTVWFCYNGNWQAKKVSTVSASQKTFSFSGDPLPSGSISNGIIVFGRGAYSGDMDSSTERAFLVKDYIVSPRKLVTTGFNEVPDYVTIMTGDLSDSVMKVESGDKEAGTIILENGVDEDVLLALGVNKIVAETIYPSAEEVTWQNIASLIPIEELDWGSVTDTSDLETDDWGYVTDTAGTLLDWGSLTGYAKITGFSKSTGTKYTLVTDEEQNKYYLLYDAGAGWTRVDLSEYNFTGIGLFTAENVSYLYDRVYGLYALNNDVLRNVYTTMGIEKILQYRGKYYLVSPKAEGTINRTVVETEDFIDFGASYTISLDSLENPAEFQSRLFIGSTDTFVGDMKMFSDIEVYSQNRCVIGDRLLNLNTSRVCSYTKDGVNFYPMPMMLSNQTAWGYKDGCSFIAVYGILNGGIVSTQIFTANDFNPVWTPQVVVPGRVTDIFFDEFDAYFVSDIAVYSLRYRNEIEPYEQLKCFCYGEQIGRPQQIMNVMKYGFDNQVELPLNALSLQEFTVLPRSGLGGEPVNYCFMREAEDGKMMVWGTPSKFGEYLKFSYVEPLTLLEGARSTPDFPDEYYEAVENGLAAELSTTYGAPIERQQALAARAQESKENAMLHDNEDTTYNIVPNQRWL